MKTWTTRMMTAVFAVMLAPALLFPGTSKDQALQAAEEWLELVDQGKYEESWTEAAALFKSAVTAEQWENAISAARRPFGSLISREVRSSVYTTSLPGAPDGEYFVIQYNTSFSNKERAVETVTPMMDEDGTWRVSGYFVK
jgi:hypothetical protein